MQPKFSIIIPMYNVEQFIARAIESVANQSYENIEIICVDDCGSDRSVEIAKEFAYKDSRVKIVQNKENLKLYLARVNGVQHATSEYILNLDGDDYLHPDTCQKCYEILENANRGGGRSKILTLLCLTCFVKLKKMENFNYAKWQIPRKSLMTIHLKQCILGKIHIFIMWRQSALNAKLILKPYNLQM